MISKGDILSEGLKLLLLLLGPLPFLDTKDESDTSSHEESSKQERDHGLAESLNRGYSHVLPVDVRGLGCSLEDESPALWSTAREEVTHNELGDWEPVVS